MNHKKYILPDAQIGAIIMEHIGVKSSEDYLISLLATKEAFKDKFNFENTPEYLDRLIRKAKVIISLSDKDLMDLQVETAFELAKGEPNYTLIQYTGTCKNTHFSKFNCSISYALTCCRYSCAATNCSNIRYYIFFFNTISAMFLDDFLI